MINKIILLLYNESVKHYLNEMKPGQLNDFNSFISHVEARRRRWFVVANTINIIVVALVTVVGMNFSAFTARAKYAWASITSSHATVLALETTQPVDEVKELAIDNPVPANETEKTVIEEKSLQTSGYVGVMDAIELSLNQDKIEGLELSDTVESNPVTEPSLQVALNNISIPKIATSSPIVWNVTAENVQNELNNGVVHIAHTSAPGTPGNIFITGHSSDVFWTKGNHKTVFALLDKLTNDDLIAINYNGVIFRYKVYNRQVVSRDEVGNYVLSDRSETLTLMTCYPVGTNWSRLIVQAERILN